MRNAKHLFAPFFFLSVALLGLFTACGVAPTPETDSQEPIASTSKPITAADYLAAAPDGTLVLRSEAISQIPEDQRGLAQESLRTLNRQIQSGEVDRYVPDDERLMMKAADPGQNLFGNCFCADYCCGGPLSHMCCKSGFGPFCWEYASC